MNERHKRLAKVQIQVEAYQPDYQELKPLLDLQVILNSHDAHLHRARVIDYSMCVLEFKQTFTSFEL